MAFRIEKCSCDENYTRYVAQRNLSDELRGDRFHLNFKEPTLRELVAKVADMDSENASLKSNFVIEECAELITEMARTYRPGRMNSEQIFEEACDALATIFVLIYHSGYNEDEVREKIKFKYKKALAKENDNMKGVKMEKTKEIDPIILTHEGLCNELHDLYSRKNADYGDSFHQTFLEEGLAMSRIRLSDKLNRFKTLTKHADGTVHSSVTDESIRDTLMDIANYALMTVLELDFLKGDSK